MPDTRQRILDASLDLFSQSGYAAVSIRDICARVRCARGPSTTTFPTSGPLRRNSCARSRAPRRRRWRRWRPRCRRWTARPARVPPRRVRRVLDSYFLDDFCNRVLRFLSMERFHSAEARALYDRWMFQEPLAFQERVFSRLLALQAVSGADGARLALRFYAPILLYAQRWLFSGALTQENRERFRAEAGRHIAQFFGEIGGTQA